METTMRYPTAEKIIEYNLLMLTILNVKKKDRPEVISRPKIEEVVGGCKETPLRKWKSADSLRGDQRIRPEQWRQICHR